MRLQPECTCKAFRTRSLHGVRCCSCRVHLVHSCVLTVWQADPGRRVCDGDQNQQLFKGFLLPLVCVSEVKPSSSEDTLRRFVVNFSLHTREVSQVLLSMRLQWETNYCQITPMQKNPRLKLSLRLLRFCS